MRPDNMNLIGTITAQQERFAQFYTAIGEDTFGNATNSVIATGRKGTAPGNVGSRWLRNPAIKARISALFAEKMEKDMITVGKVLADIEHDKLAAREKGDIASALRASELHGKYLAMFAERQIIGVDDSRRLDREHDAQNKRIAAFMVSHGLLTQTEQVLIPASFEPVSRETQPQADTPPVVPDSSTKADSYGQNDKTITGNEL